jgi:hypothetical protein
MGALLLDIRTRRLEQLQALRETLEQRRGGAAAVRPVAATQPREQRLGQRQRVSDPIAVLDPIEDCEALGRGPEGIQAGQLQLPALGASPGRALDTRRERLDARGERLGVDCLRS